MAVTSMANSSILNFNKYNVVSAVSFVPPVFVAVAGYAAGGYTASNVATVDKFLFTTDARSTLATGLSSTRGYAAGFASAENGYAAGGYTGSNVATVDKFLFTTDARSTLATGLSSGRSALAGFAG